MQAPANTAGVISEGGSAIMSPLLGGSNVMLSLAQQNLTYPTYRRIIRLQTLVLALSEREEMVAEEIAGLLHCSLSAVRNYVHQLTQVDIIAVRYQESCGPIRRHAIYRLGANGKGVEAIILWKRGEPAKNRCTNRNQLSTTEVGVSIHLLEDGFSHAYRLAQPEKLRDPLVAALFGEA
jgi:hypothetical protein